MERTDKQKEQLLKDLWYSRNPCHDKDQNGVDRFWGTALCVFNDYQKALTIPVVKNWVAVKDDMPENCDQVFVKYENGKYGINEWWESDDCWKYQFDNMIVKDWCKPPCS
jgi:hypothetical protein